MRKNIKKALQLFDFYDFLLIAKNKYFSSAADKELFKKRLEFYSQVLKDGELCFDVGANYGNRTEIFLEIGAKVVAFEPQLKAAKFLKRKFGKKVDIEKIALGSKKDTKRMYISEASTLSSLSEEWINEVKKSRFKDKKWEDTIDVEVSTLDEMIKKYGKPAFCKIDVEGYEYDVISGLSTRLNIISLEFAVPESTQKTIDCINHLDKLGKVTCNYSVGETMKFGLDNWISPEELFNVFNSLLYKNITSGDIYIKYE